MVRLLTRAQGHGQGRFKVAVGGAQGITTTKMTYSGEDGSISHQRTARIAYAQGEEPA